MRTPAHCIWAVVDGGSAEEIADMIYSKKCPGTNMRGDITYTITTPAQTQFVARWDEADVTPFYIKFDIKPTVAGLTFDEDSIKEYIESNLTYRIGDCAETATITEIAQKAIDSVGGQGYAVNVLISDDELTWVEYLDPVVATRYAISDITITELLNEPNGQLLLKSSYLTVSRQAESKSDNRGCRFFDSR